jgi:hypothetical protein
MRACALTSPRKCRESVDLFQKLFLTAIISFIAPHTAVQVIIACMFGTLAAEFAPSRPTCMRVRSANL